MQKSQRYWLPKFNVFYRIMQQKLKCIHLLGVLFLKNGGQEVSCVDCIIRVQETEGHGKACPWPL